ncbi:MAG: methylated-DNA--[protein]-cysteine S-methyltransferase [bacterium]
MIYHDAITGTFLGDVCFAATEKGLCAVTVGNKKGARWEARLRTMFPGEPLAKDPRRLAPYRRELEEYIAGTRIRFATPVDLRAVRGPFHRKVLRKLKGLPYGRLISYSELAARAGSPRAARAVGAAMAGNPLPIVIPCHRVIAAGGRLGGFSSGVSQKKRLLVHEGVEPTRAGLLNASRGISK